MTDRDPSLQDAFDRHFRGDGPPPDRDDPEAAAYQVVFSVLEEEPEGDLPDDFAEQVADRVGMRTEPALAWSDVGLLVLALAGLGAILALTPSVLALLERTMTTIAGSVSALSTAVRLDVLVAASLVLLLTAGLDRLLKRGLPLRRLPTPSS